MRYSRATSAVSSQPQQPPPQQQGRDFGLRCCCAPAAAALLLLQRRAAFLLALLLLLLCVLVSQQTIPLDDKMNYDAIRKHSKAKNYFTLLDVSIHASHEEIKKQYHSLVKQYHPDTYPQRETALTEHQREKSEIRFKEIAEAYSVLKDDRLRTSYKGELEAMIRLNEMGRTNHYHSATTAYDPFESDPGISSVKKRGFWANFDGLKGYQSHQNVSFKDNTHKPSYWFQSSFRSFLQLTKLFILPFVATGGVLFMILYNNKQRTEQRRILVENAYHSNKTAQEHRLRKTPKATATKLNENEDEKVDAWFNER